MRCITLYGLLCLPAALCAAKAPIRVMGSLSKYPPVAPHSRSFNPLVPCTTITDTGDTPCNNAGYPMMAAWMANLTANTRGTLKFSVPDSRSRAVLAHPDKLMLNHAVWRNLGLDFVTMRNEYIYISDNTDLELEQFTSQSPFPWVMSDFQPANDWPYISNLLPMTYSKIVDGVKIGVMVLWSGERIDKSFESLDHAKIVPILARRLRMQGVDKIVVFRTGRDSTEEALLVLTQNDVDVVVIDVLHATSPSYARNGTTVLTAPYYKERNDMVVLDMLQEGTLWQYSLRVIPMFSDKPAGFETDPTYLAAKQWMQVQMDRSADNDITVAELTAPLNPATDAEGWPDCTLRECHVGVLTAQAMRERAGTELAFVNGGSLRAGNGWPVGPVKRSRLWATYPYANTVCRVNVSATLLIDILNRGQSSVRQRKW